MIEEDELTFGETIKQPFPKLEDIKWVKFTTNKSLFYLFDPDLIDLELKNINGALLTALRYAHENDTGIKVTWQLKQTDQHADIKAEYEKAIADGKIVKVFMKQYEKDEFEALEEEPEWIHNLFYELRYYNIDLSKLLSWSYTNGEFVKCEFSNDCHFRNIERGGLSDYCKGLSHQYGVYGGTRYGYCRLAKGVEIKDEWLKEVK